MPKQATYKKVLVIGSGPIVIGQAAEFDYAGTQGCMALKEEGCHVVLVNNNPATMMTDEAFADTVYFEPLTIASLTEIIKKERPDGILGTLGGQTGLNLTVELYKKGILKKFGVEMLGTSAESIIKGEDREAFRNLMFELGEPVSESAIITTIEEAIHFANNVGYPIIIRPAYTLGGAGGGIVYKKSDLLHVVRKGLEASPITQCLIEKSIAGYREIEFEMMRDANDTCIAICSMENVDPVGVHTGDSVVVAPQQTLTAEEYHLLYTAAVKIIRALDIVGGCNIQIAIDNKSNQYYLIEVNPRVSRSSALASKATGYPIAKIATKLSLGFYLHELKNPVTGNTYASFEPALDYVVVKFPRWPFDKFPSANRKLGTQMKATGEVMALERNLPAAFQKAIRSLELPTLGLEWPALQSMTDAALWESIMLPDDRRFFAIFTLMRRGVSIIDIQERTGIHLYFLTCFYNLIQLENKAKSITMKTVQTDFLQELKELGFSDEWLAETWQTDLQTIRQYLQDKGIAPVFHMVDTCAGEFPAETPYYYTSWSGEGDVQPDHKQKKIAIIGSGPIRIGQGIEFDYCSVHGVLALKKAGYETILINNNPETVSTDFQIADRLYFEPLKLEDVLHVLTFEQPDGVIVQYGGQTAINLAQGLVDHGVPLLGTSPQQIDLFEDRERFYQLMQELNIPHIPGQTALDHNDLLTKAKQVGFPLLLRPSYVIGGQGMFIIQNEAELLAKIDRISYPVLLDAYYRGTEIEIDAISDGKDVVIPAIFEHIEKAGVHSGDSMAITPPLTVSSSVKELVKQYTEKIAQHVAFKGIFNIQFVLYQDRLYVLEINPRASRTVPIISKVTGVPLIALSTNVLLGKPLKKERLDKPNFYTLKSPIFSTVKLAGVDPMLSPEMSSTGEIIAIGKTAEETFQKVLNWNDAVKAALQKNEIYVETGEQIEEIKKLLQDGNINIASGSYFSDWIKKPNALAFVSLERTAAAKEKRLQALERQIIVITEIETLKAFLLGMNGKTTEPTAMTEWFNKQHTLEMSL